jgi:NAD(P)-dependent dehydrogenase (short-subunit alcohol dehydrogenase family)
MAGETDRGKGNEAGKEQSTMSQPGRNVLIVGGARGIGRVAVDLLIARGDQLLVIDRDGAELGMRQTEWGGKVKTFRMDMTNREDVRSALDWVKSQVSSLDSVVVTAGVLSTYPVEYLPDEVIDRVLEVNLVSQIRFVRDAIPLIRQGGRIVTVSSVSACVGIPMESVYAASKAGLELFFESMNIELAYKDIRCVIVQPGNVNTGFNETGNDYKPVGNPYIDDLYKKIVTKTNSRFGIPPAIAARAIVEAIHNDRLPICIVVGGNANKAHWAKRLLGRDLAQQVLKRVMGIR